MKYLIVDFTERPVSLLAIISPEILGLLEPARENPDGIDKVDAMLRNIC